MIGRDFDTSASGLFSLLPGQWDQTRTISPGGSYTGIATFTLEDDNTLHYREAGTLTGDDGRVMPDVFREYVFRREGERIVVYFPENPLRLFQTLAFDSQARAEASHNCPPDIYDSVYRFETPDLFTITHHVTGPRKGYRMDTRYARHARPA